MLPIVIDAMSWYPLEILADVEKTKRDLTVENKAYADRLKFGRPTERDFSHVTLYEETEDYLGVPRTYHPVLNAKAAFSRQEVLEDVCPLRGSKPWPLRRQPREHQLKPLEVLRANAEDGLLCMGCGKGKTVIALMHAAECGLKTLVIVDREFILEQWKREAWTTIAMAPGDIGHIQGKRVDVGNRVTVASAHTLARRDYGDEWYRQFGLIIFDEVHVAAAPSFEPLLKRFPGRRLGLSATPKRADGLDPVFTMHLGGDPVYTDLSRDQPSRWVFKRLPPLVSEKMLMGLFWRRAGRTLHTLLRDAEKNAVHAPRNYMLNRAAFETKVSESPEWQATIISDIRKAVEKGRSVLVLGSRTDQLEELGMQAQLQGIDAGVVIGSTKQKDRERHFRDRRVLLATDDLAAKALDVPRIDTLFLLFPSSNETFLQQACGRIDRLHEEKRKPLVVVYSHLYVPRFQRKEDEMVAAIRKIDKDASFNYVGYSQKSKVGQRSRLDVLLGVRR